MTTATITILDPTAPTPAANRQGPRPPKGARTVNGKVYKGGPFCLPYDPADPHGEAAKPAPLAGSSRQIPWAARLRRDELARLDLDLVARRAMLAEGRSFDAPAVRRAIRRDSIARHRLMAETSAAAIIDRHRSWADAYSEPIPVRARSRPAEDGQAWPKRRRARRCWYTAGPGASEPRTSIKAQESARMTSLHPADPIANRTIPGRKPRGPMPAWPRPSPAVPLPTPDDLARARLIAARLPASAARPEEPPASDAARIGAYLDAMEQFRELLDPEDGEGGESKDEWLPWHDEVRFGLGPLAEPIGPRAPGRPAD